MILNTMIKLTMKRIRLLLNRSTHET
ncbi:hypothetical protein MXB_4975 [Myxobolus squamalis]|nr:hypothetical protein MXB_4975 [Myxobolus squamalis]